MSKDVLGIDIGTSSVKVLIRHDDGMTEKVREVYDEISVEGWKEAVYRAVSRLDTCHVEAIGLSSQVGTYVINEREVLKWSDKAGQTELAELKRYHRTEKFVDEISMPHPHIVSYPIPRLMHIKKNYLDVRSVCQPKDVICKMLTGRWTTDKYSWRGLTNMCTGEYSDYFLGYTGIDRSVLPKMCDCFEEIGIILPEIAQKLGLREETKVYTGLNDFYAALLGMGILNAGDAFDITGTSEHFGIVEDNLRCATPLVSSEYFGKYVHYGVTASSGTAMNLAWKELGIEETDISCIENSPPIFTPYQNGERAPIFDAHASGTFFGLTDKCTRRDLAYSVLEGVAFSLYHIYETMGCPFLGRIITGGGASGNVVLNQIKAELFGTDVVTLAESDSSALGAAMVAALGCGKYGSLKEVMEAFCKEESITAGYGKYRELLIRRYQIYKELYPKLKGLYKNFKEVNQ